MTRRSDEVEAALHELRQTHQAIQPPFHIESRLRSAVRSHRSALWSSGWIPALAAAAALAVVLVRSNPPAVQPERVTSFVALPAGAALPTPTMTTILRMEIRKEDLRQYGLEVPQPVAGDLVRADFVVGEDGLARAVRFIQ